MTDRFFVTETTSPEQGPRFAFYLEEWITMGPWAGTVAVGAYEAILWNEARGDRNLAKDCVAEKLTSPPLDEGACHQLAGELALIAATDGGQGVAFGAPEFEAEELFASPISMGMAVQARDAAQHSMDQAMDVLKADSILLLFAGSAFLAARLIRRKITSRAVQRQNNQEQAVAPLEIVPA